MKYILIFLVIALQSGLVSASRHTCDIKNLDQKYILIHGIGGANSSFGSMKETLEKHYPCSKAYFFSYETENSSLTTIDFAKNLDKFIEKLPVPKHNKKDLNFIMHSQGGIVGLNWLMNSFLNSDGFTKRLSSRVNYYISLSTPFWGSDFALMGKSVFFLGIDENLISPFGKTQLEHMKYGSEFYRKNINILSNPKNSDLRKFLKDEIKMINLGGVIFDLGGIFKAINYSNSQFFEGDLVVNTPSAKLNFNYAEDLNQDYKSDELSTPKLIKYNFAKTTDVDAIHMGIIPGIGDYGIAEVPEKCRYKGLCDHPGYNVLTKFIDTKKVPTNNKLKKFIKGFELHMQVKLPKTAIHINDLKIRIRNAKTNGVSIAHYRFSFDDQLHIDLKDDTAYFLVKGSITAENMDKTKLFLEITHPDMRTKYIEVGIEKNKVTHLKTLVDFKNRK
jgi:hypothetical protein